MKKTISEKKADPVPSKKLLMAAVIFFTAATTCVTAAKAAATDGWEAPVLLSDGTLMKAPWYIMVDGKEAALVDSRETAEAVLEDVVDTCCRGDSQVLDVEIREETSAKKMELHLGDDPPDVLTAEQAEQKLLGDDKAEGYLTVITTEEQKEKEDIEIPEEYQPEASLAVGETKVASEGSAGTKEVTKRVTKENGQPVAETVVEESVIEAPEEKVILAGTKLPAGYQSSLYEEPGLSYDEGAVYGKLYRPVSGGTISSGFGARWGRIHHGLDLALPQGSEIYAADAGKVYFAGWSNGYGNLIKIDHGNGMQTYYAHCSQLLASQGQEVQRGEKIALAGSTGRSTGPHLHFEVIINRNSIDPTGLIE